MRRIVNDITTGRNIDSNLPEYISRMKNYYYRYSMIRLALVYYTYYQVLSEAETESEKIRYKDINDRLSRIIRDAVLTDKTDVKNECEEILNFRKKILSDVSALTHYVDAFKVYEHALNRTEYNFKEADKKLTDKKDEDICREVMQYILSDEDNMVINLKISEVLAELPIRITKSKFYEYLSNGLSVYKGSDKKSVEDFIYMIKTSAMLSYKDEFAELYPELETAIADFDKADFSNLTKEDYESYERGRMDVSSFIEEEMNQAMLLMEVINCTYAALISFEKEEDNLIAVCKDIVSEVNDFFILGSEVEEAEGKFVSLEGKQESIYSKLNMYDINEQIESSFMGEIDSLNLSEEWDDIKKLSILTSDSIFAELDAANEQFAADEKMIKEYTEQLVSEFDVFFKNHQRKINRAVMAFVISQLPVFFNNISELQDFIYNALTGCSDVAEKTACVEILQQIAND